MKAAERDAGNCAHALERLLVEGAAFRFVVTLQTEIERNRDGIFAD